MFAFIGYCLFPCHIFTFFESSNVRTRIDTVGALRSRQSSTDPWRQTLRQYAFTGIAGDQDKMGKNDLGEGHLISLRMCFKIGWWPPTQKNEKRKVYTPENWHVSPKNHPNEKENHLNQTSMNLCSMLNFHVGADVFCFFCWRDGQEMDKVELDVDKAKSIKTLISRLRLGLHVYII